MLSITGKLVSVATGELLGYRVQGGTAYTAVVTCDKLKELDVQDKEIAEYLDVDIVEVVEIPNNRYALVSNSSNYLEDMSQIPKEDFAGLVAYYGYIFEDRFICPFNSELAIKRLTDIEESLK